MPPGSLDSRINENHHHHHHRDNNDDDDVDDVNDDDVEADVDVFSRRRILFLLVLFDVLFAIVLLIVFLIFLTAAAEETKSALVASRLDFVNFLPRLGAGVCFAPVISSRRTRTISVAPQHQRLVRDVQVFPTSYFPR